MTTHDLGPRNMIAPLALLILLGVAPCSAHSQERPHVDLLGGVTLLNTSDVVDEPAVGWVVGGIWNLTDVFGVELQVGRLAQAQSVTFLEVNARFLTLLVGPTVTLRRGRVQPFVHVLVGTTQLDLFVASDVPFPSSGDSQDTDGTLLLGGGVNLPLAQRLRARIAYDYRPVFATARFYQHGLSASAVYGFGGS